MKFSDYQIIRREKADELAEAVGSYINQGWELVGGVCVASTTRHYQDRDDQLCASTDWVWAQAVRRVTVA